jgi:hypothetical protein
MTFGALLGAMVGFDERKDVVKDGTYDLSFGWSKEVGKKCEESFHPSIGKYKAIVLGDCIKECERI